MVCSWIGPGGAAGFSYSWELDDSVGAGAGAASCISWLAVGNVVGLGLGFGLRFSLAVMFSSSLSVSFSL